jgi:2,3,4,5-tetrahydropyridine-2-carboxylate N-succinyltransferase
VNDSDSSQLARHIERLFQEGASANKDESRAVFATLRAELSAGRVRSAEPDSSMASGWRVNTWVKKGILVGFRCGDLVDRSVSNAWLEKSQMWFFADKDTLPLKQMDTTMGVRVVPGGSAIRDGAYVGKGVICVPPMYINIGAYVGEASLIDSHALVGSCAQIGKRVHVSAGAQIGGVIEPVGAIPVIIEDEVLIGGNTGIYEGAVIKSRAVIGAGTILTGSTPIYDLPKGRIIKPEGDAPLIVPEGAVVVPGARAVTQGMGPQWGLSLTTPVIVKYRDEKTDARTNLEDWVR